MNNCENKLTYFCIKYNFYFLPNNSENCQIGNMHFFIFHGGDEPELNQKLFSVIGMGLDSFSFILSWIWLHPRYNKRQRKTNWTKYCQWAKQKINKKKTEWIMLLTTNRPEYSFWHNNGVVKLFGLPGVSHAAVELNICINSWVSMQFFF